MKKLKINLFGEVWERKQVFLSDDIEKWNVIAQKMKLPLHLALIDPYFYHYLNDKKIKTIDDISKTICRGLKGGNKNQIEIWYCGKKIHKTTIENLIGKNLLFQLYNFVITKHINSLEKGIYTEQLEIGYFGSFEIEHLESFSIENLKFQLLEVDDKIILENLLYTDKIFTFKEKETLITQKSAFV